MRNRAYRRRMKDKKDNRLRQIITKCGYIPHAGYIDWDEVDGVWQPTGKYIKYPKNSNAQKHLKSNPTVRLDVLPISREKVTDIASVLNIGGYCIKHKELL